MFMKVICVEQMNNTDGCLVSLLSQNICYLTNDLINIFVYLMIFN